VANPNAPRQSAAQLEPPATLYFCIGHNLPETQPSNPYAAIKTDGLRIAFDMGSGSWTETSSVDFSRWPRRMSETKERVGLLKVLPSTTEPKLDDNFREEMYRQLRRLVEAMATQIKLFRKAHPNKPVKIHIDGTEVFRVLQQTEMGRQIIAEIEKKKDIYARKSGIELPPIDILEKNDEALKAGYGTLLNFSVSRPTLSIDIGSGSVDIALIDQNKIKKLISLPIGPYHLRGSQEDKIKDIRFYLGWLRDFRELNPDIILGGGHPRSIFRFHQANKGYARKRIHGYTPSRRSFLNYLDELSKMKPADFTAILERRDTRDYFKDSMNERIDTFADAALLIKEILEFFPNGTSITCTRSSVRDGYAYMDLDPAIQAQSSLTYACERPSTYGLGTALQPESVDVLEKWVAPFVGSAWRPDVTRALCLLSNCDKEDGSAKNAHDIVWNAHFGDLRHREAAFLALAVAVRYGGDVKDDYAKASRSIAGVRGGQLATVVGLALRLAYEAAGNDATQIPSIAALRRNAPVNGHDGSESAQVSDFASLTPVPPASALMPSSRRAPAATRVAQAH
jgi:exopolyphosphatase/pppGpp-phosphohydrolase